MHNLLTITPLTLKISYLPETDDNDMDFRFRCMYWRREPIQHVIYPGTITNFPNTLKRRIKTDEAIIHYR